jgi:hypothetical protein
MSKAPIQAYADRLSAIFVPAVLALAVAVWAAWYIAGRLAVGNNWLGSMSTLRTARLAGARAAVALRRIPGILLQLLAHLCPPYLPLPAHTCMKRGDPAPRTQHPSPGAASPESALALLWLPRRPCRAVPALLAAPGHRPPPLLPHLWHLRGGHRLPLRAGAGAAHGPHGGHRCALRALRAAAGESGKGCTG